MNTKTKEKTEALLLLTEIKRLLVEMEKFANYYEKDLHPSTLPLEIKERARLSILSHMGNLLQVRSMVDGYWKGLGELDGASTASDYKRRIKEMMDEA